MCLKWSTAMGLCALSLVLCLLGPASAQDGTLSSEGTTNVSHATCQDSKAEFCLRTCCAKGENVISRECASSPIDWVPTFLNQSTIASVEIVGGFIQDCGFSYEQKTFSYHLEPSTKYLLSSSGGLDVQTAEKTYALGSNYCFYNVEVGERIYESVRSCVPISVPQVAGLPGIDSVTSVSVRKCCPPDQAMNVGEGASGFLCASHALPWQPAVIHGYPTQLAQLPPEKTDSSPPVSFQCPDDTVRQYLTSSSSQGAFFLESNSNLLLESYNLSIKPDSFCLDDLQSPTSSPQPIAVVCHPMVEENSAEEYAARCPSGVCVQKCCAAGFHLFNTTCIPTQLQWEPTFYEGDDLFSGEVAHNVLYGKTNCEDGDTFIFSERLGELDAPYLQKNGALHVTGLNLTFKAHQCCLEYETYYNLGTQRNDVAEIAVCCFPHDKEAEIMARLNNVLLTISAICLFVMLAIYMLVPALRNIHGKCLMSHAAALFVAFFLTVYNQFAHVPLGPGCDALGLLLYYSFIAALFWLNVMSFDIWWTFAHLRTQPPSERSLRHRFIRHSLYAWGVPLVMTGLLAFFNYAPTSIIPDGAIARPGIGERKCFLATPEKELYYFYIPIFIVTGVNIIFFIATAWTLYQAEQSSRILQRKRTARDRLKVYVNLFIIMEVSWIAECLSTQIKPKQLWYFTDIINASQGTLIFLLFIVRSSTRRAIKNRFLELTKYGFNPSARKVHPEGKYDQSQPSSRTKTTGSGNSGASKSAQSDGIAMTDVQQGDTVKTAEPNSDTVKTAEPNGDTVKTAEPNGDNGKATPCDPDTSTYDNPC